MEKTLFAFLIVLCLTTFIVDAKSEIIVDGTLSTDYIWRGFDNLNGGPAFQPWVSYVAGETGFEANAWFSWGLTNRGQQQIIDMDEVDLTLSYTRTLGSVMVRSGLFHLSWYQRENYPDKYSTVFEAFAGATFIKLPFSPGLSASYELNSDGGNDLYLEFSGGKDVDFFTNFPLYVGLKLGYFDADWVGKSGISDINMDLSTVLEQESLAITPRFVLTYVPMDEINQNHFIFWGGFSITKVIP